MQQPKFTICLFNLAGEVLGRLTLSASVRLADLEPLKALGAVRVEVVA
ncbi:hypothetical protein SAMN04244572_03185 [Azotobacter beijerinckii]|uniref:Uncharacterized protein n=1 Tax=Azotobacter beijerinckii TaxID=170623 RepID=A0A1H6X0Q4_9GAMM|nr:hypothetical protein [Azotobacter beijerinckii]SEJ09711.1 hypothetical protein SAMN04244579_03105 [Azotobacter beijerinckii]SEJ22723.1 hypothetical protein SAMN04244572_03185 [Azotobacter beijerinckii]